MAACFTEEGDVDESRSNRTKLVAVFLALTAASSTADAQLLFIIERLCDVDSAICSGGVQGLRGARGVALSPDGSHLYVVSSLDDALLAFERDASSGRLSLVQSIFNTDAGINGLDSARGVAVSPDGAHVYVAALLDSSVAVFARNAGTGALTFVEALVDGVGGVDGLGGAHAVTLSPGGEHVYVASRSEDAVAVFARNAGTGALTFLEAERDNIGAVDGLDAAEAIAVSPDGAHVYVAGESDNAVAVFARETDTGAGDFGELTFVEAQFDDAGGVDGIAGAGSVALDADGDHVYVAAQRGTGGGDWLGVFSRTAGTGALTFVQDFDEEDFGIFTGCTGVGPENAGVVVSPDGADVYLTNPFFGTVARFSRNDATGVLTFETSICDLNFGIEGIAGAVGITVSAGGEHLYTASSAFESLAVLTTLGIFGDGFESGNTAAWALSAGPSP